ncbi:MAG: ribonuclease Z [Chitinophagales bacterium]|nr:ribonuclease Z [Chitinophagales bacterium]
MNSCKFEITVLGSNSAIPSHGRHPTSQVLNHNEKYYLIDCGEGTQMQLSTYKIKRSKINHIFISHLHGDHYYGLIGLLTSYHLLKRPEPLHIYGPKGLKEVIDLNFQYSDTHLSYELISHEISYGENLIFDSDEISVTTIPMKHRIPCCGFLFREKKSGRKILADKMEEYEIPYSMIPDLKKGYDITINGLSILNQEVTADPPLPRSYAFCSDTKSNEDIIPQISNADLLYHEATFMEESVERAALTFHSTAFQAALIARKANVKRLLIGHFSAKYTELNGICKEAQSIFSNTDVAIEGEKYSIGEIQWPRNPKTAVTTAV